MMPERKNTLKPLLLIGGALILTAAGFVAGTTIGPSKKHNLFYAPESRCAPDLPRSGSLDDPVVLKERIRLLETELARSREGFKALGQKDEAASEEPPSSEEPEGADAGAVESIGKKKDEALANSKQKRNPGLPEGMSRAEQDERVRAIVDGLDWPRACSALRSMFENKETGRGVTREESEVWEEFLNTLRRLESIGVDFFDPRVARRFVPARISALGVDLDYGQMERMTSIVDDTARRAAAEPLPDHPRYAHRKAQDLQMTLVLEQQMSTLLAPEQLQEYMDEVGNDPFDSGFGFKTFRAVCAGTASQSVADEVKRRWIESYGLEEPLEAQVSAAAASFVQQVLDLPPLPEEIDVIARRRSLLERTRQICIAQGDEENRLLLALPLSGEQRTQALSRTCPVMILVVR